MIDINKKYTWHNCDVNIYEIFEDKIFFRAKYRSGNWYAHNLQLPLAEELFKEVGKYDDFKIDDKVLVWDGEQSNRHRRYFAGVDAVGRATTYPNGLTSWSGADEMAITWKHCIKEEDDRVIPLKHCINLTGN